MAAAERYPRLQRGANRPSLGPVVLGLDASLTAFGLCALGLESETYTTWVLTSKKKGVRRLDDLMGQLSRLLLAHDDIRHIALEGYAYGMRGRAVYNIGELGGVLRHTLYNSLPEPVCFPTVVPPTTLKKFVTGRGNAKKNEMLLGVFKSWDVEFRDDNEADAYALARMARHYALKSKPENQYRAEALTTADIAQGM